MKITERELHVLQIMWEANQSLMVSEIVSRDPTKSCTVYSVQRLIKKLRDKKMVDVDQYVQNKKVIARSYIPIVDSLEAESSVIDNTLNGLLDKFPKTRLLAALLPEDGDDEQTLKVLENFEHLIKYRKQEILLKQASTSDDVIH
jgi:predicted transcriptional regulator